MSTAGINIIISPAKKMNVCNDDILYKSLPSSMEQTNIIYDELKNLSYEELKKLLACNDALAELNFHRYKNMNLEGNLTPSILSYEGIQYKYMSPGSFSDSELNYVSENLKILSGFYGVLTPFDGVTPYRLEMQAKLKINDHKDLYSFWGNSLYNKLKSENKAILNLASKEYSKAIEKYLTPEDIFITCIFGTLSDGKIKVKATEAKMARGLMVRYLAKHNVQEINDVKNFNDLGFTYSEEHSDEKTLIFLK